jgi:hypothetical protein
MREGVRGEVANLHGPSDDSHSRNGGVSMIQAWSFCLLKSKDNLHGPKSQWLNKSGLEFLKSNPDDHDLQDPCATSVTTTKLVGD